MRECVVPFRLGNQVHGTGGGIDGRGPGNANLGNQVVTGHVAAGDGTDHITQPRGGEKIGVPKLLPAVYVKGINLIVLGSDEQHVVRCPPDDDARHIERLRINIALHGKRSLLTERLRPNIRHGEDGFLRVRTCAIRVVVIRGYGNLRHGDGRTQEQPRRQTNTTQPTGTNVLHGDQNPPVRKYFDKREAILPYKSERRQRFSVEFGGGLEKPVRRE